MTDHPQHSPLGGSGAARWMKCPGSVGLSNGIEDKESEFAVVGQQAHTLAEHCLNNGADAWTLIRDDLVVDKDMADAVQVYLDAIRTAYPDRNQGNSWVEINFHCPDIHEYFWGQADFVYYDEAAKELHVWDYKHGAGVVVEVENNAQLMYYGLGILEHTLLKVTRVVLHVAQPRGFHFDGPLRTWAISAEDLEHWRDQVLIPAMERATLSNDTMSGEHCRFCPVRSRACPQLLADFDEIEEMIMAFAKMKSADEMSNEQVGRLLSLFEVAKIAAKAANTTGFNRMEAGGKVPGLKLVKTRSNREFKPEAEAEAKKKFGKKAYTEPALKSPAQIDALPQGKAFTTRWAFKPDKGLTAAMDADSRPAVAGGVKHLFKAATKGK